MGLDALPGGVGRMGARCPTVAHYGVRGLGWKGTAWEFRRRRVQCSDASSGVIGMWASDLRDQGARDCAPFIVAEGVATPRSFWHS